MIRRKIQKPGMVGPNMARNLGMARNPRIGRNPKMRRAIPSPLAMLGRAPRQAGALPAGMKPKNAFWERIPVLRTLVNWVEWVFFPKAHLRRMQRKSVGTGLSMIGKRAAERALRLRRSRLPVTGKQAAILRNRTLGLRGTIVSQNSRGRINGVPIHPGQRKAA